MPATVVNGVSWRAVLLSAEPVEGSRSAGLVGTDAAALWPERVLVCVTVPLEATPTVVVSAAPPTATVGAMPPLFRPRSVSPAPVALPVPPALPLVEATPVDAALVAPTGTRTSGSACGPCVASGFQPRITLYWLMSS